MVSNDLPGTDFLEAVRALNLACARIGIYQPTVIGLKTSAAVNAVEQALLTAGHRNQVRDVLGGIEVLNVAIKVRQVP